MGARAVCRAAVCAACLLAGAPAAGGAEPTEGAALRKKLERPVTLTNFRHKTSLAGLLAKEIDARIVRDELFALRAEPVVLARKMPARSVLDWLCAFGDGGWAVDDGVIRLCSAEEAWRLHRHPTRLHDLSVAARERKDAEALARFVARVIWPPRGPRGGRATLRPDGKLEVTAADSAQRTVTGLIATLATLAPRQAARWQFPPARAPGAPDPKEAIQRKLAEKTTFDFVETPLPDVLDLLSEMHDLSIVYDVGGVRKEAPTLTLKVNDMRLGAALGWVTKLVGLRCIETPEAIVVAKPERAAALPCFAEPRTLEVHDAADILAEGWTRQEVVWLLDEHRREDDCLAAVGTRVVLCRTSPRWRAYTRWAFDAMRLRRDAPAKQFVFRSPPRPVIPGMGPRPPEHVWRARLWKAIEREGVNVDFRDTPLQDVIAFLSMAANATMILDNEALRDRGPLACTLALRNARWGTAVSHVCCLHGLRWTLKDEAVFISTPKQLHGKLVDAQHHRIPEAVRTPAEARRWAPFVNVILGKAAARHEATRWLAAPPSAVVRPGYYVRVLAPPSHQKLIAELFRCLATLEPGQFGALPDPGVSTEVFGSPLSLVVGAPPPGLAKALRARADLRFVDLPLGRAARLIARAANTNVIIDPDTRLAQARVGLGGERLSLADALAHVERQAAATHLPLEHGLFITTPQKARRLRRSTWMVYDLRNQAPDEAAAEALARKLEGTWKGNPNRMPSHFVARWGRRLIVCAPAAAQGKGAF